MDLIIWIFIGILAVLAVIGILFIFSKGKGKIIINLDKYEYSPGEKVVGTAVLKLKNPLMLNPLKLDCEDYIKIEHMEENQILQAHQKYLNLKNQFRDKEYILLENTS